MCVLHKISSDPKYVEDRGFSFAAGLNVGKHIANSQVCVFSLFVWPENFVSKLFIVLMQKLEPFQHANLELLNLKKKLIKIWDFNGGTNGRWGQWALIVIWLLLPVKKRLNFIETKNTEPIKKSLHCAFYRHQNGQPFSANRQL